MTHSLHEMSTTTRVLLSRLCKLAAGETITWDQLTSLIGESVRPGERGYNYLSTARRAAARDHGIKIDCIPKVGLKRLPPEETHSIGESARSKIGKTARRAEREMLSVAEKNVLAPAVRKRVFAELAVAGAIASCAKEKSVQRIESHVQPGSEQLAINTTLAFLMAQNGKPTV